jgi:hypothetical protein
MTLQASTGRVWVTRDTPEGDSIEDGQDQGFRIGDGASLVQVAYPQDAPVLDDPFPLFFSRHGYSDRAMIHLRQDGRDVTLVVEPFLVSVARQEGHASFDVCR